MRSPLGALLNSTPVKYVAERSASFPLLGRAEPEAMMRQMGSVSTLFAIVHRTSNSVASVDWKLYRRRTDGRRRYGPLEDDRTEVTSHWALDVWNRPNPFYTREEFVETFSQHLDLTGEGWWVVGRDPRATLPLELWPVRPDRMRPVPHPTEFISGYEYTGPDGEKVPLDLDEVIQLRMPNPLDPYRGMGPVQSLLVDLDSTRYSAAWNRNFFVNSAEPGGIVEVPNNLGDTEFKQMVARWREQHQGVSQAHRVAVLEGGARWVDRSFSMRDLQFAQLREVSREIIREAFGFPKAMLGSVDDVNRANAEANEVVFARWLLVPRLERIKQALNHDFLPLFGGDPSLEFDYVNPVPDDRAAELTAQQAAVDMALRLISEGFDPDEVMEYLGLPPLTYAKPAAPTPPPAPEEDVEPQPAPA